MIKLLSNFGVNFKKQNNNGETIYDLIKSNKNLFHFTKKLELRKNVQFL